VTRLPIRGIAVAITLALALAAGSAAASADTFSFSGDRLEADLAKGRERTILSGHARLLSEQFVIEASSIELYGDDFNLALCRGDVHITDTKNDATFSCQELHYDRKEKVIRLQGNAVMEDRKNEMVIKGEMLENRDKEGVTLIQIGVRILKKDLASRSQTARYYRDEDRLELSGLPVVRWKGDTYRAGRIRVDLKTDKIQLEGAVAGEVSYEEKPKGEKKNEEGSAGGQPQQPAQPAGELPADQPAPSAPAAPPAAPAGPQPGGPPLSGAPPPGAPR
jgi:lipopolysaccharide export system protein LptA